MNVEFENSVIQNAVLASELIYHCVASYEEGLNKEVGLPIKLVFLVLPVTLNKHSMNSLATRQRPGALYKAIAESRDIPVGLQQRMEAMFKITGEALNLCFASNLLRYNNVSRSISINSAFNVFHNTQEVKDLIAGAKRVGYAFAEHDVVQLCDLLKVRF